MGWGWSEMERAVVGWGWSEVRLAGVGWGWSEVGLGAHSDERATAHRLLSVYRPLQKP